ncbi:MAG TPA: discoidin domain-containing protein [Puia sp.]|nr:discoidin domain-containing protein [Puia sp.]
MLKKIALFVAAVGYCGAVFGQSDMISLNSDVNQVWQVRAESDSSGSWVAATVPGTVFGSFVANGLEKDPNFGDNIYKVDHSKYDRNFWYRTSFRVPAGFTKEHIRLNFKGINRKADIYLNGGFVGHLDGFMERGDFDISDRVLRSGENSLMVLVYWPKTPLANYSSPTYLSSAGWDWMPYVPGLNMGITDQVFLSNTGSLTIRDPWVQTRLPTNARADLAVSLEVKNGSSMRQEGIVKGVIMPGNIGFERKVLLDPLSKTEVQLQKIDFPQLSINSPKLWWPNGYGDPNLYTCTLSVVVGGKVSDEKSFHFGIKRYDYDTIGSVLHLFINGVRVFAKGGDWGMSEYMLRCRGVEYDTKVRLHREMNFNMIRNWIGSTTDEEFYEACDKYGIMVWDDFWLNANPNLPDDVNTFNANAVEKIKRFRNHPAIAVWCGDNEGWPEAPLNNWLREDVRMFDGNARFYQPNSHAENLTGSGPWANKDPRYYFSPYPSGMQGNAGWGFRTELGTAVFVNFESFKKFMPQDKWWPRNEMWNLHFFGSSAFNAGPDFYDESITREYGSPTGIEDYCRKAQLLNVETNKAMFEGWQDNIGDDASGLMTWMSQSAYPSMVWQTYDYYYDLTGAFWGAKKACEPLHIQWNPVSNAIKVVNTTGAGVSGLTAVADVYNMDGTLAKAYSVSGGVDAPAYSATECFVLPFNDAKVNLALGRPVVASSTSYGEPGDVADGKPGTRWASNSRDDEWIYVDLGTEKQVNGVGLNWEYAYAKSFKVEVSLDAVHWKEVYATSEGRVGEMQIGFPEASARFVRIHGVERGSYFGYSLYNFEVYEGNQPSKGLSDVHFIVLKLRDNAGVVRSDNFYWRGNRRRDYTALNTLPHVNLQVSTKVRRAGGRCFVDARITNPLFSPAVAFGIRVQVVKGATAEQILPGISNDNYFSLLKGEMKEVHFEFDAALLGSDEPRVIVEPYNNAVH